MFSRLDLVRKEDVFLPLSGRPGKGVYFLRLTEYSQALEQFLWQYHEEARARGVIIENQISNPDDRQLNYYADVLGTAFQPDAAFIASALQKWMPRMNQQAKTEFSAALNRHFEEMRAAGKNENIQKNVFIKMMCWLYYRFERAMISLGQDQPPRVLYEGSSITKHELSFLRILSAMGMDILLMETKSDDAYLRLDPQSQWSQKITEPGAGPFPPDYTLKELRRKMARQAAAAPVRTPAPAQTSRPNVPPARPVPQRPAPVQTPRPNVPSPAPVRPAPQRPAAQPPRQTVPPAAPVRPAPAARPALAQHPAAPRQPIDVEQRFPAPARSACTNAWMKEAAISQILLPPPLRGDDHRLFYNAFIRVKGVPDKLTYVNDLYQLYQNLTVNQRRVLVIDGAVPVPEPEELQKIRRRNYRYPDELIVDLAGNLPASAQVELQRSVQRAFVRTMKDAAKDEPNINRLTVTAVYLLCWIQRYQAALFQGWKETDVPCFIKMGPCETPAEALYALFLSRLPVDVLILSPNLNQSCVLQSDQLLEIAGPESLPVMKFPKQSGQVQMRTVAANAEEDLTAILYGDSGIYRNRQFGQAETITLQTTFDEVFILWEQELKYRPNFSTGDQTANIPVLYAKISGVEDGKVLPYWQKIRELKETPATLFVPKLPMIEPGEGNRFQPLAVKCIKNERIRRDDIKASRQYPFGLLREEMQDHIFDKLQQMLDQRLIKGTFVNGTEYTVLSTVLNMKKELIRLIQGFDFTKMNPKLLVVHTRDQSPSLEDAILLTFLNKLGFDIALFVPTGYQTIERFLSDNYPVEHQIGEYIYDLNVPDFSTLPVVKGRSWLNQLLRRGN